MSADIELIYRMVEDTKANNVRAEYVGELIRCKECRFIDTKDCMGRDAFYGLKDDDFCSWAERKEE